jgi:uncharacterized protein
MLGVPIYLPLFALVCGFRIRQKRNMTFDIGASLALNNAHAKETSMLDSQTFCAMIGDAYLAITDAGDGLLIAFSQDADYDGINFRWFKERYPRFIYVDRIIVGHHMRGKRTAAQYYHRLFEQAKSDGYPIVTCEINTDPPNLRSLAFHISSGFTEVGKATLTNGKTVSYQHKIL